MPQNLSGYAIGGSSTGSAEGGDTKKKDQYWSHEKKKRAYLDYIASKREEIDEQQEMRRFVHGSHWTSEELRQLKERRQPAVHENITSRKVRGIVGTLAKLKQDPKAYPRTPKHEQGAELSTAVLNYALDSQNWNAKDPLCAETAAIDGIGGVEFNLTQGDQGDPEIEIDYVEIDNFFYDPRSVKHDFSDATYLGVGKWLDIEQAVDLYPDYEDDLRKNADADSELSTDSDREQKWFRSDEDRQRVRMVELWYKKKDQWYWCIFTGAVSLDDGESYLVDEKKRPTHKYEMFSAYVDQEGDRYGICRDLKPLNRELNMRRSKALYTMLSRRIIAPHGSFDDIEVARREAARSDGVVLYNVQGDAAPTFDDMARQAETEAQFKFYESLRTSIESFGPNIAVTGEGLENSSGRAIHLLQQAGLADLGPFIQAYRDWKIRVYRKMWNAIQKHWSGERWIRVTDDDDLTQFIQINGVGVDPQTGFPTLVNSLGNLDVDIQLDEGPDEANAMGDAYDTLQTLAKSSTGIPPEMIKPYFEMLIELSPLAISMKKRLLAKLNPEPTPEMQQQEQLKMRGAVAEVAVTEQDALLKKAQATKAYADAGVAGMPDGSGMQQDHPMQIQTEAMEKMASAELKKAQAEKARMEARLKPQEVAAKVQNDQRKTEADIQMRHREMVMNNMNAQQDRNANMRNAEMDRAYDARDKEADRRVEMVDRDRQYKAAREDSDRNYKVNMKKASQKPAPKGNK